MLQGIDREYDLYDVAVVTRAGQAKALGMKNKGHLGLDADADIAVYDLNPKMTDCSRDYWTVRGAFEKTAYTIKGGEVVAKNGVITKSVMGKTMWADTGVSSCAKDAFCPEVLRDLKKRFREYWTVEMENYVIPENYLKSSAPIQVKPEVQTKSP